MARERMRFVAQQCSLARQKTPAQSSTRLSCITRRMTMFVSGHCHPARDARQPSTLGKNLFPAGEHCCATNHLRSLAVCPPSQLPGFPPA